MNKDIIKGIFSNIVRTWPYIPCSQPNTFFVIDDGSEFETENLNAKYSDFIKGDFWQREWVLSGADPNQLCKKYPIVGIEQKKLSADSIFSKSFCYQYWVVIADIPECIDCPNECNRSKDEVDRDLFENALIMIRELKKYKEWEVTKGEETFNVWLTEEQINYLINEGFYDGATATGEDIYLYVKNSQQLEIQSASIGLTDGARAISFPIDFCDCSVEKPDFNYEFSAPSEKAVTMCYTCM